MSQRNARLQVPIDQGVLDQLQKLANDLGFDSVPAMIRFWAKAELSQQDPEFNLNQSKRIALRYVELILALGPNSQNPDTILSYLINQLQRHKMKDVFKGLSQRPTSDRIFGT